MDNRKRKIVPDDKNMLADLYKEWDDVSCPICMEHPHNAVLLICSSQEKGCLSYICDTSYRHSNCLDRFKKLKEENPDTISSPPNLNPGSPLVSIDSPSLENNSNNTEKMVGGELNLKCPLCRGSVLGFKVIEEARKYLNSKLRSCSRESCPFSGNYKELRGHARSVHPTIRPADIDPVRERAWRQLEDESEYNDVVSAVPGSVVVGDYAIERGDDVETREDESVQDMRSVLILHMMRWLDGGRGIPRIRTGPVTSIAQPGEADLQSIFVRHPAPYPIALTGNIGEPTPRRRYVWGENLLGFQDDRGDDDEDEDEDDDEDDDDVDDGDDDNMHEGNELNMNVLSDPVGTRRRLRRRITQTRSGNQ